MNDEEIGNKILLLIGKEERINSFTSNWIQAKSGLATEQINRGIKHLANNGAIQKIITPDSGPFEFSSVILLPRGKYLYSYVVEANNVLRVSSNQSEVLNFLTMAQTKNLKITLWQKIQDEVVINYGEIQNINRQNKSIQISLENSHIKFNMNQLTHIFIRDIDNSVLFKESITFDEGHQLTFAIPKNLRIIEKRSTSRYIFSSHDLKEVKISKISDSSYHRVIDFQLSDLSNLGMSLMVLPDEIDKFATGDTFLIHKMACETFTPPLQASVIYIAKSEYKKKKRYFRSFKVGLKFTDVLDNRIVNRVNLDDTTQKDDDDDDDEKISA